MGFSCCRCLLLPLRAAAAAAACCCRCLLLLLAGVAAWPEDAGPGWGARSCLLGARFSVAGCWDLSTRLPFLNHKPWVQGPEHRGRDQGVQRAPQGLRHLRAQRQRHRRQGPGIAAAAAALVARRALLAAGQHCALNGSAMRGQRPGAAAAAGCTAGAAVSRPTLQVDQQRRSRAEFSFGNTPRCCPKCQQVSAAGRLHHQAHVACAPSDSAIRQGLQW